MLHRYTCLCPARLSLLFHAECSCCLSILHANAAMSMRYAPASWPFFMSIMQVHAVCSYCVPFCRQMLHAYAACPCGMHMLHIHFACPCCMSMLHTLAENLCCMHMLHVYVFILHVHAACLSCLCMLHEHVHAA
jgi:hypothetical protein